MTPLGKPLDQPAIRPFNASMIASKPAATAFDRSTSVIETLELMLADEFGSSEERPIAFKRSSQTKKSPKSFSELVLEASAAGIVAAQGTDLVAYLVISCKGMQTLVGYMLGDNTAPPAVEEGQKATPIEISLMQLSARRIAAALSKLSPKDSPTEMQAATLQSDRQSMQTLSAENPVAVYELQVVSPHSAGSVTLAFNANVYDHLCGQPSEEQANPATNNTAWQTDLDTKLKEAKVELVALIDGGRLQLSELTQLNVGTIVPLCRDEPGAVLLLQNQMLLSKCTLGQADGKFSLRVEEMHERADASSTPFRFSGYESQPLASNASASPHVVGSRNV